MRMLSEFEVHIATVLSVLVSEERYLDYIGFTNFVSEFQHPTSVVSLLHGCVVYFLSRVLTLMEKKKVAAEGAMRKQI
ncbi:hypothetical protein NC652_028976 [Populus alba x Populus x berolinensis]|nr:hypothetical protein NC652_028976 [Populus alba x Populus x berolinensis]